MILLHHPEVELSRTLLDSTPEGVEIVEGSGGYPVSAYPSVVVMVPAYAEDRAQFGQDGEFLGMARVIIEAHEEVLRMPGSWQAVESFVTSVTERALANPAL